MTDFLDKFKPYAIFGKKVARIVKKDHKSEFYDTIICPYCGEETFYGDTYLIHGNCVCEECKDEAMERINRDKEQDPQKYETTDYQPYGVTLIEAYEELAKGERKMTKKPTTKSIIEFLYGNGWDSAALAVEEWAEAYKAEHPSKPKAAKEKKEKKPSISLEELEDVTKQAIKESSRRRLDRPLPESEAYKKILRMAERRAK